MALGENTLSSNVTGLAYAEEVALKILPDGVTPSYTVGTQSDGGSPIIDADTITLAYDHVNQYLTIKATIDADDDTCVVRVDNGTGPVTNIGTLVSIDSPGKFSGSKPTSGAIGQWVATNNDADTQVTAVVSLKALVANGDVITVKFATNVAGFGGVTESSNTITLTTLGTGTTKWRELEPNSYDALGAEIETVKREPINATRQQKKGVVVDVTADGGFNTDITQTNIQRLMQGFFFADAHERATSDSLLDSNYSDNSVSIAEVTATASQGFKLATAAEAAKFKVGQLIKTSGFTNSANNGVFRVDSINTVYVTVEGVAGLTVEAAPPAAAKIEVCGFEFPAADISGAVSGGVYRLSSSASKFDDMGGIQVGEWIYVGGDDTGDRLSSNTPGFARVAAKASDGSTLDLDECTWTLATAAAGSQTVRIYFGTVIKNEATSDLIKERSYQIERQLGKDTFGTQSQYLTGAVANEFKMNIPSVEKLNADLSFSALDSENRSGLDGIKAGTRISVPVENAMNTTSHVYQMRLYIHDSTQSTPESLFGFVMDGDLTINNNVENIKAIGTLGALDVNTGNFDVSGSLNVYFAKVNAIQAVRDNSDVGFNVICCNDNAGFVFDIPLLSLGGGKLEIEKDSPIMLPLENMAAENVHGYTMLSSWFCYLPTIAMDS